GLPPQLLGPRPIKPSYFTFLGRIAPEKRVDLAIHIAEHCGVPLKIAAKVDKADQDYFKQQIRPAWSSARVDRPSKAVSRARSLNCGPSCVRVGAIGCSRPFSRLDV